MIPNTYLDLTRTKNVLFGTENGICDTQNIQMVLKIALYGTIISLIEIFSFALHANKDSYEYRGPKNNRRWSC